MNARPRRSRASSTPPCEAASISMTSMLPPPSGASDTQDSHVPHGSGVGPCTQLSDRARMRALVVLPHPRGPRSEEHTSELQSRFDLVCRLLLENKHESIEAHH